MIDDQLNSCLFEIKNLLFVCIEIKTDLLSQTIDTDPKTMIKIHLTMYFLYQIISFSPHFHKHYCLFFFFF